MHEQTSPIPNERPDTSGNPAIPARLRRESPLRGLLWGTTGGAEFGLNPIHEPVLGGALSASKEAE